ncbi:hypothetical protein M011DRAFT_493929 [Sporormia fimetaria CBS 119925]|uniref:Altered inheritance of mitochondria protein 6 n=1 Tax=Sporormia fimetaria CBS 119925 TaxID=1340428 RepID=A0A6A6VBN7_9PLEO|nr:hypothetical protein M011DRAFT_493929 [Sporormia fimetaria CBS 119925]
MSFVGALLKRLSPSHQDNGLERIASNWKEPDATGAHIPEWKDDLSRDITPKNCHSHNDYWRSAPLYSALAAGCTGIEADIWLESDSELRVSHDKRSIRQHRTLKSLYLDPLSEIMTHRNVSVASTGTREAGVFDKSPEASVILLIDFKTDGHETWPVLVEQLRPLHEKGWLSYFNGSHVLPGAITVVGTGNTPFDLVQEMASDRFIFFDAPLESLSSDVYTSENSYYASIELKKAVGSVWLSGFNSGQEETLKKQIEEAGEKGLVSRYWGTPDWPVSRRNKVWVKLMELGVGTLNVDDLEGATRWDWGWCVVAGLNLCG